MEVRFYGKLRDMIGSELDLSGRPRPGSVGELRAMLAADHPHAAPELTEGLVRAFVEDRSVSDAFGLAGVSTVEFFPSLSGG